jgi:hypothetical protein
MAGAKPRNQIIGPETGAEPHYHITDIVTELEEDGTITIRVYQLQRDELRLQFSVTVMAANLIRMGRAAMAAGAEGVNSDVWRLMAQERTGSGH